MKRSVVHVLLRVFAVVFFAYVLFTIVSLQVSIARKRQEVEDLQRQVAEQTIINEELQKELDESDRDTLIRHFAEKNGYAYQGEKIFIDEAVN